jgi:hypothetical protein
MPVTEPCHDPATQEGFFECGAEKDMLQKKE